MARAKQLNASVDLDNDAQVLNALEKSQGEIVETWSELDEAKDPVIDDDYALDQAEAFSEAATKLAAQALAFLELVKAGNQLSLVETTAE